MSHAEPPPNEPLPEVTKKTFSLEKWRAGMSGILETTIATFLVLIAIRTYEADAGIKALLSGGYSLGLLGGPLVVYLTSRIKMPASHAAGWLFIFGGSGFLAAAILPGMWIYVIGSVIGTAAMTATVPLVIQVTHDNYPANRRGYLFSRTALIRIMVAVIFGDLAGRFLTDNYAAFPWVVGVFAVAMYISGWLLIEIPSGPIKPGTQPHPLVGVRILREDVLFRNILIAWFVMGFGNLMLIALRVEYIGNPVHGIEMTAAWVAFLTVVVPSISRLLSSVIWGKLFDRINFFVLRVLINCFFGAAILCYFMTQELYMLIIGSVLFGVARGGGEIAWSLWVTKFAKPENVADYMAVHTFLTGVRGFTAPFVAFYALDVISFQTLAWIGFGMTTISSLMIWPQKGSQKPIDDDETLSRSGVTE